MNVLPDANREVIVQVVVLIVFQEERREYEENHFPLGLFFFLGHAHLCVLLVLAYLYNLVFYIDFALIEE